MKIIPKNQRLNKYLVFALIWISLGVVGAFADPGNYFFYGFPLLGLMYLYAYFTDSRVKEEDQTTSF